MTVEAYAAEVRRWFATATHPTLAAAVPGCGYMPMVELLRYLEANGFTTYIASGGDRDFMRPVRRAALRHPAGASDRQRARAWGSRVGDDVTGLLYKSKIEFFDDGPEKPVRIWSRIGRRPLIAGGNSNGDVPMLRFARRRRRDGLRLLVLHDDADREFDYVDGAEELGTGGLAPPLDSRATFGGTRQRNRGNRGRRLSSQGRSAALSASRIVAEP